MPQIDAQLLQEHSSTHDTWRGIEREGSKVKVGCHECRWVERLLKEKNQEKKKDKKSERLSLIRTKRRCAGILWCHLNTGQQQLESVSNSSALHTESPSGEHSAGSTLLESCAASHTPTDQPVCVCVCVNNLELHGCHYSATVMFSPL